MNRYPADNCEQNVLRYPPDRDLPVDSVIHPPNKRSQKLMSPCQSFKFLSQLIAWVFIPSSPWKIPHKEAELYSFGKGCVTGGKQTVPSFLPTNYLFLICIPLVEFVSFLRQSVSSLDVIRWNDFNWSSWNSTSYIAVGNFRSSFRCCYVILRDREHLMKKQETRDYDLCFAREKGCHPCSAS